MRSKRVRTVLGGKTIAPVFSGDAKQFATRPVDFYPGEEVGIFQ